MKITHVAAALAVTALALTGCGKQVELTAATKATPAAASSTTSGNFPTPDPADLATSDATPAQDTAATSEPDVPQTVRFGTTYEWEDGLTATVSKPTKFTPSPYAAAEGKFKTHVMFTITVKNGTKEKIDLFAGPNVSSGDTEGGAVFDTDKGLEGTPNTAILPGRSVKFKVGFGVKDANDIVMEYAPTLEHEDATFTSK